MDRRERLMEAGNWLRSERERRGISARDMAVRLGVLPQTVYNWEAGKSGVDDARAEQLTEVLGIDLITTRRHLGLWVPAPGDQKGDTGPLPRAEDYGGIVVPMPDGSGNVYYSIRKEELAKMSSEQRQRLAQEMIEFMMEIERQQPPEADDA